MIPSRITPDQFFAWRKSLGMSCSAAARKLGVSPSSIHIYERGARKEGEVKIPLLVSWAMTAISSNLKPYGEDNVDNHNHDSQG